MTVQDRRAARRGGGPVRSLLFVCTANICRSPFAERLASWMLPDLQVSSAGVIALEGRAMDPPMAAELERRGCSPAGPTARQVSGADLEADLILVMSRRHRRPLLEERPDAVDRIGLLTSLPGLADAVHGRVLDRRDIARWARSSFGRPGVVDPYGQGAEVAAEAADLIARNVELLADLIAPDSVAVYIDEEPVPADEPGIADGPDPSAGPHAADEPDTTGVPAVPAEETDR